jgi:uncharacterized membrane protein
MLSEMAISFGCAFTTISIRALINVADRSIFSKDRNDFIASMTLNSLFPFFIALVVAYTQSALADNLLAYILHPGVFFSALAAQVTAYGFSFSFKKMPVRNVVVSSKLADILLPFCIWIISHRFGVKEYLFSIATIFAFTPIMMDVLKTKAEFSKRVVLLLIFTVLFQSSMNEYLQLKPLAADWTKFLCFMTALFFWRSIFVLMPLFGRWVVTPADRKTDQRVYPHLLFLRAALAYTSSAFFFYAIIHGSSLLTWPTLSAGPLVSTFFAYLILREKVGKPEMVSLALFMGVVGVYVLTEMYT